MIKADRIDVLVTDEGEFREGDIVQVELGIMPRTYHWTGRIIDIDTLDITLDCSKPYNQDMREIKYADIWHIVKVDGDN
jgi:hypothetical protein